MTDSSNRYFEGAAHYDRETVRFFDIAHEGAQLRAVAEAAGRLEHLAGVNPRSVVVLATDQIAAAAARCALTLAGQERAAGAGAGLRWPVMVANELPGYVGPLDVVVVVGDAPDAEAVTRALSTAAGRGAETVLAGPQTGPVVEDAPDPTVVLPAPPTTLGASPLRTIAAVTAVLQTLEGATSHQVAELAAAADDVDEELRQLSPERDSTTNLARQLREFVAGKRIMHTGYTTSGAAVAEVAAVIWAVKGLAGGFVDKHELAGALEETSSPADDIFHDPYLDGPVVSVATIVWGEDDPRLPGGRAEQSAATSLFTQALCLIVRAYATTALSDDS
nr:Uncharacterised protein [Streptococcus thermophilus]